MEKKYKKLEAFCGCTIEKAVNMLESKTKESGELFFIDFNGHTLVVIVLSIRRYWFYTKRHSRYRNRYV